MDAAHSVVVKNSAQAGGGGNGTAGGFDWDDRYFVGSKGGFPGGIGGTGGSVFGSGIFGSSSSVQMMASTISGNVGNAGRGAVEEVVTALPVGKLVQADEVAMCLA